MGGVRTPTWWDVAGVILTGLAVLIAVGGAAGTVALAVKASSTHDPWHPFVIWAAAPYAGYALLGLLTLRSPPAAAVYLLATSGVTAFALWLYASVVYQPTDALDGLVFFVLPALQWVGAGATGLVAGVLRLAKHDAFRPRGRRQLRPAEPGSAAARDS